MLLLSRFDALGCDYYRWWWWYYRAASDSTNCIGRCCQEPLPNPFEAKFGLRTWEKHLMYPGTQPHFRLPIILCTSGKWLFVFSCGFGGVSDIFCWRFRNILGQPLLFVYPVCCWLTASFQSFINDQAASTLHPSRPKSITNDKRDGRFLIAALPPNVPVFFPLFAGWLFLFYFVHLVVDIAVPQMIPRD